MIICIRAPFSFLTVIDGARVRHCLWGRACDAGDVLTCLCTHTSGGPIMPS